jgi:hypothetical protein
LLDYILKVNIWFIWKYQKECLPLKKYFK